VLDPAHADRGLMRYLGDSTPFSSVKLIPVTGKGFKENIISGCPTNFQISMDGIPNQLKLNTPNWHFIPLKSINSVFCSSDYVAVVSSIFPDTLIVDILTKGGGT
jgi:hypothetical protein